MVRRAFVRPSRARRAAVAVAASTALISAFGPLDTVAVAAGSGQETVVPATYRDSYTTASLVNDPNTPFGGEGAGLQGVFHRLEGHSGVVWTRYSDGRTFDAPAPVDDLPWYIGTSSDTIARARGDQVDLWNAVDSTTRTVHIPAGQTRMYVYGNTVATTEHVTAPDNTITYVYHLLTPRPDGTTRDVTLHGGPEGMKIGAVIRGDASGLMAVADYGGKRVAEVDPDTGQVRSWTPVLPTGNHYALLSPNHLVMYSGNRATKAYVYSRADLSAPPVEVALDSTTGDNTATDLTIVGDWLVHSPGAGRQVTAVPIAGGDPITLLPFSNEGGISAAPDGTALVVGRTGADDWGIQRIHPGEDGRPVATMVKVLPKPPYPIQGLSLNQGRLVEADASSSTRDTYGREVAVTGPPVVGERSNYDGRDLALYDCPAKDVGCSQVFGTASGLTVWLERDPDYDVITALGPQPYPWWRQEVPRGGRITGASDAYVLYTTADNQYVYGGDGQTVLTRAPATATLAGNLLWTAAAEPGRITAYDLAAKKTVETLTLDSGCTPTELQVLGRYVYWTCGDRAGVYDRTAKKSVPVPADEAKLGDGYVVTHDKRAGKLVLTSVVGGTAKSRVIGDLPDTGVSQRDVRWTVDPSGPNVAYVDDKEQIHLVPSGVAEQPLRLLDPARSASVITPRPFDTVLDTLTSVRLSKPAAGWRLTVRSKATGKVFGAGDSTALVRGELKVPWSAMDEKKPGDVPLPNGTYQWTLSLPPADGVGAPLAVSGSVRIESGSPVFHDHVGSDGFGDLLTLNPSGAMTFQQGTGKGTFSGKVSAKGWSTKSAAVPFGDLNKDRCNDVLVRTSSGELRGYKVTCGAELSPYRPYTSLGTGWNAYNVLVAPGDLTGDGRTDLLARKASTGDMYLFAARSDGKLAAGKRIRTNWKAFTQIVGAGDLNGDGIGDVVARYRDGTLYRYDGLGNGLLKDRVTVFRNWGSSYNAIVGVGDITGDGRNDLVERDTKGYVYRNAGDGKGSFGSRTRIATGWGPYKGLF